MKWCGECNRGIPNNSGVFVDLEKSKIVVTLTLDHVAPQEALLMEALVDTFPRVASLEYIVERLYLHEADEPEDAQGLVRVLVVRLRKALEPIGVEIATYAHSYALEIKS